MKKVWACLFFLTILFFTVGIAYSQSKIATSDMLSIDVIQKAIKRGYLGNNLYEDNFSNRYNIKFKDVDTNTIKGIGVFQEGYQAEAYISFVIIEPRKTKIMKYKLIRFNSGKWFFPDYNVFLMK